MVVFTKPNEPRFSVEIHQNPYLPEGGRQVDAIAAVTASGGGTVGGRIPGDAGRARRPAGSGASAAVALMVDCSGSMAHPPLKMREARQATAAAIDTLRDGVRFAVIAGTHEAAEVYPGAGRLATADAHSRALAKRALRGMKAGGGTALGTWLRLADRLLSSEDVRVRHGILLTDGRNEHETPGALRDALAACAGRFTCDVRGVGTDWDVAELTGVASALLGNADIVADPADLAADFARLMATAMGKELGTVSMRLWTPVGTSVTRVAQVAPSVVDLTDRHTPVDTRHTDYPTGSWGEESRVYHLRLEVPAAGIGREMLAARVSLVVPRPGEASRDLGAQGLVRALWTDDLAAATASDPHVAHYDGQAELAQVVRQGLELRRRGDVDGATVMLGHAVRLADASGNEDTARLLVKVVDVVDAAAGTVRLKTTVGQADEMALETRSTKTVRVRK
ncbi:VWA domain-containing protein [Streptomyces sp. HSG2]|uniref:VWA domain-containing protein n=1 Tax=Streptomyces sp. HSG2 TaxID=2797167 RepID=UPI0019079CB6|nr:VWA domain-containing protein [Streptomyces sp. HSG2]